MMRIGRLTTDSETHHLLKPLNSDIDDSSWPLHGSPSHEAFISLEQRRVSEYCCQGFEDGEASSCRTLVSTSAAPSPSSSTWRSTPRSIECIRISQLLKAAMKRTKTCKCARRRACCLANEDRKIGVLLFDRFIAGKDKLPGKA